MKKYSISFVILCLGLCLCLTASAFTVKEVSTPLAKEVLRLHVLANSDSDEDQQLKLKVKAAVTDALAPILSETADKTDACQWVSAHLTDLEEIAAQVIADEGYDYPVSAACETTWFPNKTYGDMIFPCGYYDALRICIGEAKGANWWCVLYPPLCFVDLTCASVPDESKEKLQTVLDEDDYNSLFPEKGKITVRFKLLDWLGEILTSAYPTTPGGPRR